MPGFYRGGGAGAPGIVAPRNSVLAKVLIDQILPYFPGGAAGVNDKLAAALDSASRPNENKPEYKNYCRGDGETEEEKAR